CVDERDLLSQALPLVAQATGAEWGGIMLVEPTSGRLVFRAVLDDQAITVGSPAAALGGLEHAQALAGWSLANRQVACIANTDFDTRWPTRADPSARERSVLAA